MAKKPTLAQQKKAVPEKLDKKSGLRAPRSPKTNLIWALVITAALFAFSGDAKYAISAGIFGFLFFNTVDYIIFYNRYKKENNHG